MPKIEYIQHRFSEPVRKTIDQANEIIEEFEKQGFDLTLRQLYYQFVARGLIENTMKSYKRLGSAVNDGRMAGMIDWNSIIDRGRNLRRHSHWDSPADVIKSAAAGYACY